MKLAVLADIHANFPALQAVAAHIEAWQPDQVIIAGDIINRGPSPLVCLHFVQEKAYNKGWRIVCGNHEEYTLNLGRQRDTFSDMELTLLRFTDWTAQKLSAHFAELEAFPFQQSLWTPNGQEARIVHASMRGNRDGVFPMTSDEELRQKIAPAPSLLGVGHTHWPLIRPVDQTIVVNVGAVGLPFDQDHRASYGQITWQAGTWHPKIIRLDYDRDQAEKDFIETGFLDEAGPIARLILDELQHARSHLYRWTQKYQPAIMANALSVETAVESYLASL